ncbi:dynein-like protein, putative [Bodo saltans]|uniref:Dynein-like protein, putative n=1 Tax=Bodo saltans TaxID=75058 RepID=A0A0S4IXW7_BODSA|nr:dynein-like protein, putative [Bodo saltans]|eukprot:CUG10666.1 dynein-like protein, putative [Bodo saltans]
MRSVERLRINNQRVAVPLRLIETNEGHLPLASFIQALDPQPLQLHGTQSTFLTADPEIELSNTPVCKIVTVDSGKRTQSSTWEVCEIIHHDPTTSTYKVRLPRVKDSSGNPVEKLATRAALSTASELRSEEHTTLVESASLMRAEYERQFRTELVLDLWESDESSSQAMGEDVIKRVLRLTPIHSWSKDNEATLTKELQEMRMMCGRALNQAKLSYLALHPHFRKLLRPLDISFPACEPSQRSNDIRTTPRVNIGVRHRLEDSIRWRPATKLCLENITRLWNDKYGNIVLLDTAYGINEKIAFPTFVRNARNSLEVGVALMRVSLLSDVDVVMMTDLHESGVTYNHVSLDAYRSSSLCKIFLFAQVFLSSSMRNLARASALSIENLFKVVTPLEPAEFGVPSDSYYLINGKKQPNKAQLVIDLKYIEGGTVRTFPELQRVENELLELIDDMTKELNHFPKPDVPVMASLQVPIVFMDVVPPTDDAVLSAKQAVQRAVADAGPIVSRLVDVYSQHSRLVEKFVVSEAEYFQDDTTNDEVIERIENEVFALRKIVSQVTWSSADFVSCGILAVDCTHAKQTLLRLWETKMQDLLVMLERKIFETSLQAVRICRKMRLRLVTRPTCVEELDELLTYSEDAKKAIALIRERDVTNVVSWVSLLERLQHPVNEDAFSQAYQLVSWPSMIDEAMEASEKSIIVERTSMAAELETYKSKVYAMIRDLNEGVTGLLHNHSEQEKSDVAVTLARSLRLLTEEIEERIVVATRREGMLGMELSDYSEFFPIRSTFEALEQFWVTLSNSTEHLQRFYDTPIAEANSDKMIDAVETWRRLLHSATRSLRGYSALFSLGRKQEHCLMAFENATPVIEMLTQPGVRQIHWKEISRRLGIPPGHELLPTDPTVTIQRILSEGAMDHIDDIAAIVSQAATDFAAETHLEKMKSDTRRQLLVFETLEMPAGQVNVLANGQEINALIDNFVMQSQHLHSRYNLQGGLAQVAAEWETMLHTMQDTMQLWISLQTIWLQLRPTVLAPNESASVVSVEMVNKFRQVDDLFRQILDELDRPNQNLFVVMTIETLPNRLLHVSNQLTTVRDGILLLMDAKRAAFPRFYFLNDKEMLTCLSALNTRAVIGLLQRMYPRLTGLDLFKGDVSGFVSSDGVRMRCEPNYAVTSEPIEIWMHGLEAALVKALRSAVEFALNDFSKTQARVWLLRYSGQLVDVVLRVRYAVDLEEVLSTVGTKGLTAYLKKSLRMLEEYFHVSGADLGQFEHRVVSNSIAFLLYCREEVQALIDEGVHSVEHLEGFPIIRTVMQGGALRVKLFHMTVPYGNEFLGNYSAPIMTPIMFRSVRTMLLSYISCTKSILAGTGGIGKRQTMGDFATYLGAFLWSVQCHEHMTLATLAPLFRALVGIGGWLCLDDIDLLRPEILTEVCKILDAVDVAQRSTTNAGSIIEVPLGKLPGEMISLQVGRQFNLMATSSVSYEGLPATISTSFRPIFLQAVDFAVIAKTYLCALGFENEFVSLGDAIGSIFQQFHDVLPGVFSVRSLVMILRSARNIKTAPTLSARLSIALRDAISPAVKCFNQEMELLFEARVSAISTDHDALTMSFAAGPEETVSTHSLLDFERTMFVQSNVIVYGAHYSRNNRESRWSHFWSDSNTNERRSRS